MGAKLSAGHTDLLADKLIPGLSFPSRFSNKRTRVGEETIFINVYSVECTGCILRVFCEGSVNPAFHHLSMGPIWEP